MARLRVAWPERSKTLDDGALGEVVRSGIALAGRQRATTEAARWLAVEATFLRGLDLDRDPDRHDVMAVLWDPAIDSGDERIRRLHRRCVRRATQES